jgi:hypothetical protein
MRSANHRRAISDSFDNLHEQLAALRSQVESLEDPIAGKFVESMELGLLAPMRKLRLHLDIPYDWHDEAAAAREVVR